MRILLPPSESKREGGRGKPLTARPADGPLAPARAMALDALSRLLAGPGAAAALMLPPSVSAAALADNARVLSAPTLPALRRYAGVVYDGLALEQLSEQGRRLAGRQVLVFSGLFGVVRGDEPIPAYRVPAKAQLPGLGVAGTFWRRQLGPLLPPLLGAGPILDLRSSDYAGMWQPAKGSSEAAQLLTVRILSPTPTGRRAVVSYNSKLAKGKLAAAALERAAAGRPIEGACDLAQLWSEIGGADATVTGNHAELIE
ncbi:MAG TPA: peroxide stress protein YaaA [Jatrophihabitans sp.]|nr:peroxide stress protein YaaA [Jatrophihabitans sp.]